MREEQHQFCARGKPLGLLSPLISLFYYGDGGWG